MRTNVVLDDALVTEAMKLTGAKTKREVLDQALRALIRLERQRAVLDLRGKIPWEGDLNAMRQARYLSEEGGNYPDAHSG